MHRHKFSNYRCLERCSYIVVKNAWKWRKIVISLLCAGNTVWFVFYVLYYMSLLKGWNVLQWCSHFIFLIYVCLLYFQIMVVSYPVQLLELPPTVNYIFFIFRAVLSNKNLHKIINQMWKNFTVSWQFITPSDLWVYLQLLCFRLK